MNGTQKETARFVIRHELQGGSGGDGSAGDPEPYPWPEVGAVRGPSQ